MNKHIAVRTNAIAIIEIDTSDTSRRNYSLEKTFHTPKNILATQLTITDLGGGFTINVNNSGALDAVYGYAIENEEIADIEIFGSGVAGTGKIRIGALM
jgi:hypothetical protein